MFFLLACVTSGTPNDTSAADTVAAASVWVSPIAPTTADALVAATDADTRTELTWSWYRDNTLVDGLEGPLVAAEETTRGEVWRVVLAPDVPGALDQPVSATATIANSPPVVEELSIDAGLTVASNIVPTIETSDADSDAVVLTFAWSVDGALAADQTGASLPAGIAARGQEVSLSVTPDDGTDTGDAATLSVVIENAPPTAAAAVLSATSAEVGEVVSVTVSGWADADDDAESYLYTWHIDGAPIDEDREELEIPDSAAGSVVHCAVTPFDGTDAGEALITGLLWVQSAETDGG